MIKFFKIVTGLPISYLKMALLYVVLTLIVCIGVIIYTLIFILAAFMVPYYLVKFIWKS